MRMPVTAIAAILALCLLGFVLRAGGLMYARATGQIRIGRNRFQVRLRP